VWLLILLGITILLIVSRRHEVNHRFWMLVAGLAVAPAAGLLLISVALNKNLWAPQYVAWAAPALSILLTYPIARLYAPRRILGLAAMACIFFLQTLCVNWGYETGALQVGGDTSRTMARIIKESWSPSQLVLIDQGCKDL